MLSWWGGWKGPPIMIRVYCVIPHLQHVRCQYNKCTSWIVTLVWWRIPIQFPFGTCIILCEFYFYSIKPQHIKAINTDTGKAGCILYICFGKIIVIVPVRTTLVKGRVGKVVVGASTAQSFKFSQAEGRILPRAIFVHTPSSWSVWLSAWCHFTRKTTVAER